jgi:hypothetical protein
MCRLMYLGEQRNAVRRVLKDAPPILQHHDVCLRTRTEQNDVTGMRRRLGSVWLRVHTLGLRLSFQIKLAARLRNL